MRLLVKTLEKRRFGAERRHPRQRGSGEDESELANSEHPRQRGARTKATSRYIPATTRRAVFDRDEGRCTYVDERGQRCREMSQLQIHHLEAFANGGRHELANLTLRCEAHNTLAAEEDFGREHIERKREGGRHESLRVVSAHTRIVAVY